MSFSLERSAVFKSSALLLALVLSAPALWSALSGQMTMTSALIRLLIAIPAAALMIGVLRWVTGNYVRPKPTKASVVAKLRESAGPGGSARV